MSLLYVSSCFGPLRKGKIITEQKYNKRPSPILKQVKQSPARDLCALIRKNLWPDTGKEHIKETPLSISGLGASMTVEAAIVLPLLLFFFLNLFSALDLIRLHSNLQTALWETGRQMTVYAYAYDKLQGEERNQFISDAGGSLLSAFAAQSSVVHYLGEEYLAGTPLTNGPQGLNFLQSSFMSEEDCIDIKVTYQATPWFNVLGLGSFRMCSRFYGRAWTGYALSGEAQESDYVFVTEHGSVYHETLSCTYLQRMIEVVNLQNINEIRNDFGEKYDICELCGETGAGNHVYVTHEGNRYHWTIECSALKRMIRTIPRLEAQSQYRPCSRCGKEQ